MQRYGIQPRWLCLLGALSWFLPTVLPWDFGFNGTCLLLPTSSSQEYWRYEERRERWASTSIH
ncbi:hypothetical protein CKAH01_00603 [Colletotrichum kahawae]|uniref:Uncharacterized protein n=1 Tax=Colletotrichum kahawae TaxID=34407 RepID=A0AAE0D8R2_COLKA|nr:hypothetical protein CKAH01_00603 [Colletotrichum kahawae]